MGRATDTYRYDEAAQEILHFFWHEFCDWYREVKSLGLEPATGLTGDWGKLLAAFEAALRLLHPVMPFLTEELWQRLAEGAAHRPKSIALARYPEYSQAWTDLPAEREIQVLQDVVTAARTLRAEMKLDPKARLDGVLYSRIAPFEVTPPHPALIQKLDALQLQCLTAPP